MKALHLGYLLAGGLALLIAVFSYHVRRLPVSGPLLALALGALAGPYGLDLVAVADDKTRDLLLLEAARIMLAVSLIGVALRFPIGPFRSVLRPVVLLVLVVMPLSAAVTGGLAVALLGFPVALAFLLGACLCPTDPVLASDVVSGEPAEKDLPEKTRATLSGESGLNDGLALPLVLLALAPVLGKAVGGEALTATYQVVVASLVGAALGALTALAVRRIEQAHDDEPPSVLVVTLVMAVLVLGACRVLKADGVLGVFVAGLAYNAVIGEGDREAQDDMDEVANRYLVVPFFLLVGVVLPWDLWADFGPGAVLFALAVLLLRRPPLVVALTKPLGLRLRDGVFAGWFGPIGVSAVFYVALSLHEGVTDERLLAAGLLAVAASTLAHGITAVPGRKAYARVSDDEGPAAGRRPSEQDSAASSVS